MGKAAAAFPPLSSACRRRCRTGFYSGLVKADAKEEFITEDEKSDAKKRRSEAAARAAKAAGMPMGGFRSGKGKPPGMTEDESTEAPPAPLVELDKDNVPRDTKEGGTPVCCATEEDAGRLYGYECATECDYDPRFLPGGGGIAGTPSGMLGGARRAMPPPAPGEPPRSPTSASLTGGHGPTGPTPEELAAAARTLAGNGGYALGQKVPVEDQFLVPPWVRNPQNALFLRYALMGNGGLADRPLRMPGPGPLNRPPYELPQNIQDAMGEGSEGPAATVKQLIMAKAAAGGIPGMSVPGGAAAAQASGAAGAGAGGYQWPPPPTMVLQDPLARGIEGARTVVSNSTALAGREGKAAQAHAAALVKKGPYGSGAVAVGGSGAGGAVAGGKSYPGLPFVAGMRTPLNDGFSEVNPPPLPCVEGWVSGRISGADFM